MVVSQLTSLSNRLLGPFHFYPHRVSPRNSTKVYSIPSTHHVLFMWKKPQFRHVLDFAALSCMRRVRVYWTSHRIVRIVENTEQHGIRTWPMLERTWLRMDAWILLVFHLGPALEYWKKLECWRRTGTRSSLQDIGLGISYKNIQVNHCKTERRNSVWDTVYHIRKCTRMGSEVGWSWGSVLE